MKTQTIAGYKIMLLSGVRYYASRPMGVFENVTVTIEPEPSAMELGAEPLQVEGLSIAEADALLSAFNNGEMSFDGRVW